jgi:hypothetical protein
LSVPQLPRHGLIVVLSALLILASTILVGQTAPAPCPDSNSGLGGGAAALKPSDVLLAITSPRAGEMLAEAASDDTISVTVDYWGPRLEQASLAHKIDDYHLVFFLDVDDQPYVGTLSPTPRCNPSILHSATTSVTFNHVRRGPHTVYVMLVGSNDVSVNPPVAGSATFSTISGT